MGRRNWLQTGRHFSAQNLAFMFGVLESCKLNKVNFGEYIVDILTRILCGEEVDALANAIIALLKDEAKREKRQINFVGDKSWKVITEKYIDFIKQFYKLMADLFNFVDSDCSPSCKEQNFTIQDEDTLAQHVAELLMGQYRHVGMVLDALDSTLAVQFHENQKKSIISILRLEEGMTAEKRDGWIFQMISWIIVYLNHQGENFRQQAPHHQPAQHGIDGFAVVVKDGHLKKILITEDKCTKSPRGKITGQVFPEFDKYESYKDATAIFDSATTLLEQISDKYADLQNEVNDSANWVYRICVTRDASHKDGENIAKLYKDYEKHVSGDVKRRTGSSTYIDNLREWMQAFSEIIIQKIEAL